MIRHNLVLASALLLIICLGISDPATAQEQDRFSKFKSISGRGELRGTPANDPLWHEGRFSGYTNYWQTIAWRWRQHGNLFLVAQPDVDQAIGRTASTSPRSWASQASSSNPAFSTPGSGQIPPSFRTPTTRLSARPSTAETSWFGSSRPASLAGALSQGRDGTEYGFSDTDKVPHQYRSVNDRPIVRSSSRMAPGACSSSRPRRAGRPAPLQGASRQSP